MRMLAITFLSVLLASCGGDTHQSLADKGMAATESLVTALEGVKDKATWDAAQPALNGALEKLNKLKEASKALPKQSPEDAATMAKDAMEKAKATTTRMTAVMSKLMTNKDISKSVTEFMTKFGQSMAK